jgi:hypothetical protein
MLDGRGGRVEESKEFKGFEEFELLGETLRANPSMPGMAVAGVGRATQASPLRLSAITELY